MPEHQRADEFCRLPARPGLDSGLLVSSASIGDGMRRQKKIKFRVVAALSFLVPLLLGFSGSLLAQDIPLLKPVRIYDAPAKPLLDDDDDVSTNISGIGCLPPTEMTRHCLMVDDEGQRAQVVRLDEDGLTVTDHRPRLIREDADPPPFGTAPADTCPCRKSDPDVTMVQSAEDRQRQNAPYSLDRPR